MPELIFVAGCNAAGKSTFIRTRLNELESFEILMTDVYKSRTKDLAKQAIDSGGNVLIETVFDDASFRDIADYAVYCLLILIVLVVIALISMFIGYRQASAVAAWLVNGSLFGYIIYIIVVAILKKRNSNTKSIGI